MLVLCIDRRLNHVHFVKGKDGVMRQQKIVPGDVFPVEGIPPAWKGLVEEVLDEFTEEEAFEGGLVVNPQDPEDLVALKKEYKALTGRPAHHLWSAEQIREKIAAAKVGEKSE